MNETLAIINATVYPISSPPIQNGVLIVKSGKIQQIGKELPIPEGACVIDAKGKVLLPGFVDAHTHIGIWGEWYGQPEYDGNEGSNPVTPSVRAIDSIWPAHFAFEDARSLSLIHIFY